MDEVAQLVEVVLHLVVLLQLGVVEAGRQAAPLVAAFAGPNRAPQPLHLLFILSFIIKIKNRGSIKCSCEEKIMLKKTLSMRSS